MPEKKGAAEQKTNVVPPYVRGNFTADKIMKITDIIKSKEAVLSFDSLADVVGFMEVLR